MRLINRRVLALIGATAAAVGTSAFLSAPAQAAATGTVKTAGTGTVQFTAAAGKANGVTVTVSGKVVTVDDKVALKPGTGCAAVAGDKTKVTCTLTGTFTTLSVKLGDKNDWVKNKTSAKMTAEGGAGNDTIYGGSSADKIYGNAGNDTLYGGAGNDKISAGAGTDKVYGGAGDDDIYGGAGNDKIWGQAGDDGIQAGSGNDVVSAGNGHDVVIGLSGNDTILGGSGDDILIGETITETFRPAGSAKAKDKVYGNSGIDLGLVTKSGKLSSIEAKTLEKWYALLGNAGSLSSATSSVAKLR